MTRRRLDVEMVRRGLVESRQRALRLIESGAVVVGNAPAQKAARLVAPDEPVRIIASGPRFVSRGGDKLDAALDRFAVPVDAARCLDAGASTGGFTDALLQAGAAEVVAVDVGRAQLHERLRRDERVRSLEQTDIREVAPHDVDGPFPVVVADLSFISLRSVIGSLLRLTDHGGHLVVLVKPQFEAGRAEVSKGRGVIRDAGIRRRVVQEAAVTIEEAGAVIMDAMVSPLRGAEGNVEFLLHIRHRGAAVPSIAVGEVLARLGDAVEVVADPDVAPTGAED